MSLSITHVLENLERGGLERVVVDLAEVQAAAGHRVRVVCLFQRGPLAAELQRQGIEVMHCGKRAGTDLAALARLRRALRPAIGGIVHTHNAVAHYHAAAALLGLGRVRLLNTRHGMGATEQGGDRSERLFHLAGYRTDAVVAVCEAARAAYATQVPAPRLAMQVVPNGIRMQRFAPGDAHDRERLRGQLGFAPGTRLVGSVGRLNFIKDHASLLHAHARIQAQVPDTGLVVVGSGPELASLRDLRESLGLADRVHLLGDRDDVPELLRGLDLFVLPSTSEGYSLALVEACAAGLPIIATDVGGNREIVMPGRNGMLVPAEAPDTLAASLIEMLQDPETMARMGRSGRAWALAEGSRERMAQRYEALYIGKPQARADAA